MKKFWVVLLSLGLVMAFSMSAFAVSADFTGQYYVRQNYYSNPSLLDQDKGAGRDSWANTDQRLRLFTRLKVVEGVTLTIRTDIMENTWGSDQGLTNPASFTGATSAKQMRDFYTPNAAFEQLFLTFNTGLGTFVVGNKSGTPFQWGTWFLNNSGTAAGIYWERTFGNIRVLADLAKTSKGDMVNRTNTFMGPGLTAMDRDRDYYDLAAAYKGKDMEGGLMLSYFRFADKRGSTATSAITTAMVLDPYFKAKFGPIDVEGEGYYMSGKVDYSDARAAGGALSDQSIKAKGLYLQGKFNVGPAWVGLSGIYASGADPNATAANGQDITGGYLGTFGYATDNYSGVWSNYTPNILFGYASDSYHTYLAVKGRAADIGQTTDNLQLINLIGGTAVGKNLTFDGKLSFAKLDKVDPLVSASDKLGTELDVRGSYKIYDCLSYNVGFAYLWTGDYYKGTQTVENVANNYYLTHWIDLRF
jgi:hypothetical protein